MCHANRDQLFPGFQEFPDPVQSGILLFLEGRPVSAVSFSRSSRADTPWSARILSWASWYSSETDSP